MHTGLKTCINLLMAALFIIINNWKNPIVKWINTFRQWYIMNENNKRWLSCTDTWVKESDIKETLTYQSIHKNFFFLKKKLIDWLMNLTWWFIWQGRGHWRLRCARFWQVLVTFYLLIWCSSKRFHFEKLRLASHSWFLNFIILNYNLKLYLKLCNAKEYIINNRFHSK